jgi:hypothetical protein
MNMEQLMEWELAKETEVLGENLSQNNSVSRKSHMTWPGIELEPLRQLVTWAFTRPKEYKSAYHVCLSLLQNGINTL